MTNPYDLDLDRNPANFQPLTPLSFLERAASVFPDRTAIIHGSLRRSYADFYARTRIFGDPTDSKYTVIEGYRLVNGTIGFRSDGPWEVSLWARNLFNVHYLQNVTVQAGNSGLIVGTPNDPRTYGVTLRARY